METVSVRAQNLVLLWFLNCCFFTALKLRMAQLSGAPEISPLQEQKLKEVVWAVLEGRPVPAALHALQDGGTLVKETQGVPGGQAERGV